MTGREWISPKSRLRCVLENVLEDFLGSRQFFERGRNLAGDRSGVFHCAIIAEERVRTHRFWLPGRGGAKGYSWQLQPINRLTAVGPGSVDHTQRVVLSARCGQFVDVE